MSDPRRLGERDSEASSLERDLIHAGRSVTLDPRRKQQIWAGVVAHCSPLIGAAAAAAAPTAGAGATGFGAAALLKGTVVLALLAGGSVAGYRALRHEVPSYPTDQRTAAQPQVEIEVAAPRVLPATATEAPRPLAPQPAKIRPAAIRVHAAESARSSHPARVETSPPVEATAAAETASAPARASRLAEESRLVMEARRALRSGDAREALRLLESATGRFPDGALVQEREALSIEALARSGQREAAARRAGAFLRAFPNSPHAANVKSYSTR